MKEINTNDFGKISGGNGPLEETINYILATTPAFQDNQFGAIAYTSGYDIYLSSFNVDNSLLPHEAWHTLQQ